MRVPCSCWSRARRFSDPGSYPATVPDRVGRLPWRGGGLEPPARKAAPTPTVNARSSRRSLDRPPAPACHRAGPDRPCVSRTAAALASGGFALYRVVHDLEFGAARLVERRAQPREAATRAQIPHAARHPPRDVHGKPRLQHRARLMPPPHTARPPRTFALAARRAKSKSPLPLGDVLGRCVSGQKSG